ncbi:MAG TPA: PhaM family polyhydroxyalkanoate granule multifunctional regulatory protein [Rhodocyclaceae bacterium]|nr:PhaM family polyhydroxyalkanoate granule multifunctional regulatory protein [Rhodocyclaceae bacterium]
MGDNTKRDSTKTPPDPFEALKTLWGGMGIPLPGMVAPTFDTNELDRQIANLKVVEGWLQSNLSLLKTTLQGLEMQRATLAAMQQAATATPPEKT